LFSNDTADRAAALANQGAQKGYDQLSGLYGQGRDALTSNYGAAQGVLGNAAAQYQPGFNAYGDASGAGGVAGLQRATDAFKNSGQYGVFGVANDAAQQAIQRAHAAGGNLLSGNTDYGAAKTASDLAQTAWGGYQAGLQPYLSYPSALAGGQANLYAGLGNAQNQSYTGQGGAANTTQTAMGNNLAGAELNNYKVGANQLNGLLGIGQLAMGLPPTSFGNIGAPSGGGGGGGGNVFGYGNQGGNNPYANNPINQGFSSLFSGFGNAVGNAAGGSYGGTAANPLPGLSASDYGTGANSGNWFNTYGLG
jgi:hypothetical protein